MAIWRMAFRNGEEGPTLWPRCQELGVAAITYAPALDTDFSRRPEDNLPAAWSGLKPNHKTSLKRFLYKMQAGDVIYVKEGPQIVGRGIVTSGYQFDRADRLQDSDGAYWRHQRRVSWCPEFRPVTITIGVQPRMTIVSLKPADVESIESAPAEGG